MSHWFSIAELDDLKLPALKRDRAHLFRQAQDEGWQSRPRAGRGGGREYYIGSLPEAARFEIGRRALASDGGCSLAPASETSQPSASLSAGILTAFSSLHRVPPGGDSGGKAVSLAPASVAGQRASARMGARQMVVALCARFAEAGGLGQVIARQAFTAMFNAGEIPVEKWVQAEVGKLTMRSLERWQSQVMREGVERLAGKYGHRKGQGQIDGDVELRGFCISLMAANGHLTAKMLREAIKARFQREIPKRTIQRFMSSARVEHANAFLAAQNPDAWKNKRMVAFGSMSEAVRGPNDVWEADASPADIMLLDPNSPTGKRRYHLIANIDVWSRRAKVLVTETPKSTATLLLIRDCEIDWGMQKTQKTDNGKDFVSARCSTSFAALNVHHHPCPPFTPEGKPHIERFFGTLQRDLIATLPGFIGHSVADRKAIEGRRAFSARLGHADELIEATLTKTDLQAAINDWLEHDYHVRHHEGLGTSPNLKMASWDGPIARIDDVRALDTLLAEAPDTSGLRVVGKKGLRVENALFISPELWAHVGDRVQVRLDPEDMGQIVVYTIDGDFICVALCPERVGVDRRELAMAAKADQREHQRDLAARMRASKRKHRLGDIADEVAAMKRDDARRIVNFPRAEETETYSTRALDAAGLAARALRGDVEPPRPLSSEDREMAAEVMASMQAEVIPMPARAADTPPDDDFQWMLWARERRAELNSTQLEMLAELERSPTMKMRLDMRSATRA